MSSLAAETCRAALSALQTRRGRSPRTRNHYLSHAKQFARWCVQARRLRDNPFLGLRPVSDVGDRRHDRRCLTPDELARLFAWLKKAPERKGTTAPQRALMYKIAMATGLRAKEVRSLTRESFDLDAATVTVAASHSKRRRQDTQPLPAWLVAELRKWFAAGGPCWDRLLKMYPGRLLKWDLARAGVPYTLPGPDGAPLYADFHSLRHSYITTLANLPSISPKTLLALARHSSPHLTLQVYSKVRSHDLHAAAAEIPVPGQAGKNPKKISRKSQARAKKI